MSFSTTSLGIYGILRAMKEIGEPQFHSGITDVLPLDHPFAYTTLYCSGCREMVHAGNNECMQPWLETNTGPYCIPCWERASDALDADQYGWESKLGLDAGTVTTIGPWRW